MVFDTHFKDQVRNSVDIVEVVGEHVRLKKSGQNYVGLCPFHNEKTPSFNVSPARQIYKCFGCDKGGDVFDFVMQVEGLTFPESLHSLAERAGIPVPHQTGVAGQEALERRRRMLGAMERAATFYRKQLDANAGGAARRYLVDRGLQDETIETYGLGFAPPGSTLRTHLRDAGFSDVELESCGLVKIGEGGAAYDKFRNRVMFPIRDLTGRTIAFGGRALGEGGPKYLNSPETPLYHKGRHLFGLDIARDSIRRRDFAILVEGNFDCIVPWQFGFTNVVASLGTALTQEQVHLLGRYARRVIVSFDPDSAGLRAAQRSVDLFLEGGFQINVVQLPGGRDPDTFLREEGAEAYAALLKTSGRYLDFLFAQARAKHRDPASPRAKQQMVDDLVPYVKHMPNRIERAESRSQLARWIGLDEALLLQEERRMAGPRTESKRPFVQQLDVTPAERNLLAAVCDTSLRAIAAEEMEDCLFEGLRTHLIFQKIIRLAKLNPEWSVLRLREDLPPEDVDLLERLLIDSAIPSEDVISRSVDALRRLQRDRRSRNIQREIETLKGREQDQDALRRLDELLQEKARLRLQRE